MYITLLYMGRDLFQNNDVSFTPLLMIPLLSAALKDSQLFSHLSLYRCRRFNNQRRFFFFIFVLAFAFFNFLLEAVFTSQRCITLLAINQSVLTLGPSWQSQQGHRRATQTHAARRPARQTRGRRACVMEEGNGKRGAPLNDRRHIASPQEAKRPSVILRTPAGSAPAFGSFLVPRFCFSAACRPRTNRL